MYMAKISSANQFEPYVSYRYMISFHTSHIKSLIMATL